ncbi:MAG: hypothetical protein IKV94_02990 [Clostridia bacterium]|nr:hypothetical protein [Clostridia bacterium]
MLSIDWFIKHSVKPKFVCDEELPYLDKVFDSRGKRSISFIYRREIYVIPYRKAIIDFLIKEGFQHCSIERFYITDTQSERLRKLRKEYANI